DARERPLDATRAGAELVRRARRPAGTTIGVVAAHIGASIVTAGEPTRAVVVVPAVRQALAGRANVTGEAFRIGDTRLTFVRAEADVARAAAAVGLAARDARTRARAELALGAGVGPVRIAFQANVIGVAEAGAAACAVLAPRLAREIRVVAVLAVIAVV